MRDNSLAGSAVGFFLESRGSSPLRTTHGWRALELDGRMLWPVQSVQHFLFGGRVQSTAKRRRRAPFVVNLIRGDSDVTVFLRCDAWRYRSLRRTIHTLSLSIDRRKV